MKYTDPDGRVLWWQLADGILQTFGGTDEMTMKKVIIRFTLLTILSICLWSCLSQIVLEYNDIDNFEITECRNGNELSIKISGLCMHSNYVIKKIDLQKKNDELKIKIKISIFKKKNDTGRFLYELKISDDVQKIFFGNDEVEIWHK